MAHPDNLFYGHSRALSEYAGEGPNPPVIWGHIQHGWAPGHGLALKPRLVGWLPKLVYSEANAAAARAAGIGPVVPIGAPFCYLAAQEDRARPAPPRSTIAYPFHGWERDDVRGSHRELARSLAEREQGPVTVCLYWREYDQPDVRRIYEDAGFRVVTHGYREDSLFLRRLHDELLQHDRLVTNRVATALWYGGLLGREIEVYGPVFSIISPEEASSFDAMQRGRWPELFSGPMDPVKARALAASELGAANVRVPQELREVLGWTGRKRRVGSLARAAVHTEHQVRRAVHTVRVRRPGSRLARF